MKSSEDQIAGVILAENEIDERHLEKQVLALDALSELTRQFAVKPDFDELLNTILFTFSGQFGVGSCFILVRNPQSQQDNPVYASIGKFKNDVSFELFGTTEIDHERLFKNKSAKRIEQIKDKISNPIVIKLFEAGNLKVIVPLYHGGNLFGLIGLGDKLKIEPFSDSELELMTSISNAITPLIVNTFLFKEISALSDWYHEIINNVKQGVLVFDENRKLTAINEAGMEILTNITCGKCEKENLLNKDFEEILSEQYFHGWQGRIMDLLKRSDGNLIENAIAGDADTKLIFNIRATVIKRDESSKGDLVVTLDEITEQKQNEQKMFNLERLADKGLMAASISHELNNFLGLILAGVELTQASIERKQNDNAESTIQKVKENISKMIRYTTGLMDYSRLETNMKEANINEIIEEVLSFLTVQKKFKNISIKTNLEGPMPSLQLDVDQIAQLLMNLLNNGADAILESNKSDGQLEIRTLVLDNSVVLKVTDNGSGMTAEVKDNLFKKQLTTKKSGHGFGLVTCGKIIKNHNGKVEITSKVGSGSTFEINFPVSM